MADPTEINSVYWDEEKKSWQYKMVHVDEYHGFVECQHCRRPMSHNIKTDGEFKVVYVKCGCSRQEQWWAWVDRYIFRCDLQISQLLKNDKKLT